MENFISIFCRHCCCISSKQKYFLLLSSSSQKTNNELINQSSNSSSSTKIIKRMFLILFVNFILYFIIISSSIIYCKKKKKHNKAHGNKTHSDNDPPSKKCNTKGGLLADDPDLKSFERKQAQEQKNATFEVPSHVSKSKKPSLEGTDLKSFDDNGGPRKKKSLVPPEMPGPPAVSAYANPPKTGEDRGISMLAMEKIDKDKLPVKAAPKQPEVIAQDSTQVEEGSKKNEKSMTTKSHTVQPSRSKRSDSVIRGGGDAQGKKKKNLENMLDAMMDKTQSIDKINNNEDGKTQAMDGGAASKTKLGDCKTQLPTKAMDLSSQKLATKKMDEKKEKAKKH